MSEAPIEYRLLARRVKSRAALKAPPATLTETRFLAGSELRARAKKAEVVQGLFDGRRKRTFKVDMALSGVAVGQHRFPPGVKGTKLSARRKLLTEEQHRDTIVGYLPDHLARRVRPETLDKRLVVPVKVDALAEQDPK